MEEQSASIMQRNWRTFLYMIAAATAIMIVAPTTTPTMMNILLL
jgi:hypothetical protein